MILFRSGSPTNAEGLQESLGEPLKIQLEGLETIRTLLITYPQIKVRLLGYTDGLECDGVHCNSLSLKRAEAVRAWMIDRGVDSASFSALEGRGAAFAVGNDETLEGSQVNRRLEFDLEFPDAWK